MDDETEFHFDATTLVGDLRDAMLGEIKDAADGRPWNERPEVQQRAVVERIHDKARAMVKKAVLLMSDKGFASLHGELVQVQVKDGFKAVVEIPRGADFRHELVDAAGKEVVLVLASHDDFRGTRGAVPITPPAPLLEYADEAARVADAAETPPEGWQEQQQDGDPTAEAAEVEEAPAAQEQEEAIDDGVLLDAEFAPGLEGTARFMVKTVATGSAIWHVWRDAQGDIRGHDDLEEAQKIAARQKEAAEDDDWDTAEDRARKRSRRRGTEGAAPAEVVS